MLTLTAYIEKEPKTGLYVAIGSGIPGAHTQAETLDELQENLIEVLELCSGFKRVRQKGVRLVSVQLL